MIWKSKKMYVAPSARWGFLDFKIALRPPSPSPPRLLASSWSQWALLDLNCQLEIPVNTANRGPLEPSGHPLTSTRDLPSPVGTVGPQPGTSRARWALLDLNSKIECQIECQNIFQVECQIDCQNICQVECQIECQNICQIPCQNICQIDCPNI